MNKILSIARYNFNFEVTSDISLPDYAGSTLRGIFGRALRQLACFTKEKNCNGCMLKNQCSYIQVFEPLAQDSLQIKSNTPPVPYIIHAPAWGRHHYKVGETLSFGMTLVGEQAIKQLPLMIMAWQRAFARGVGSTNGTADLIAVTNVQKDRSTCVYEQNGMIQTHNQQIEIDTTTTEKNQNHQSIQIKLITPMRLQQNGSALPPSEITAYSFLMGIVRRISLLDQSHQLGFNINQENAKDLSKQAQEIEIEHDLRWQDWVRYSTRQRKKMALGGCIGNITLKGDLTHFLPYLNVGEYLNVGKEASFGLGQYQLT
jgi:hypothetical protein